MIDVVVPSNNEEEFVEMALKLGYDSLCFVYNDEKDIEKFNKIKNKKIKAFFGLFFKDSIKNKKNVSLIIARSSDKDRLVIEQKKADVLVGLEMNEKQDSMHHRNSGLNQVMCKLMKEKEVIYCINFGDLLYFKGGLRSKFIGRSIQNVRFCSKYKVPVAIASFAKTPYEMRNPKDLVSFVSLLGLKDGKKSLIEILNKIKTNQKRKSKDYVGEGIEVLE